MTLRAYRPNETPNNLGDQNVMQNDWQDTLLDRPMNNRQSSLRVAYGSEPKSKLWLLTGLFAAAAILVTGYFVMQGRSNGDAIPLIQADTAPYKSQPDQPGGAEIPFQDKLVFNRLDPNGKPVQAEKLLPPAEQPMASPSAPSATTVTRTVTAPPVSATAPAPSAAPTTTVTAIPVETAVTTAPVVTKPTAVAAAPAPTVTTTTTVTTPTSTAPTAANPKTGTAATAAEPEVDAPVAMATPVAEPKPVATPKPAPAATTATTASTGQVRIQLASIPDQANAQKALPTLSSKYASALGGAKLSLVKADITGKGTYWRVQSQPMSRATADSVCTAVKAQGGVCITAK